MVELLSHFGNDLMVVNVARVSYGKESKEFNDRDYRLLRFLHNHKHTSPFRHPQLQFRIDCPIYVERQLFKHQIGISVNSISGRYVDFSDSYTKVETWRKQSISSKQGSDGLMSNQKRCNDIQDSIIETCKAAYDELIKMGVSKEQARSILPLSLNTKFIWTGSLLAFFHLCSLRLKSDTQAETSHIVETMLQKVKNIEGNPFEGCLNAFNL